jgi:hypothetical protein
MKNSLVVLTVFLLVSYVIVAVVWSQTGLENLPWGVKRIRGGFTGSARDPS